MVIWEEQVKTEFIEGVHLNIYAHQYSQQHFHNQDTAATQVSINEQMDKEDVLNIHTMDCYSDIKSEILPFAAMWINKENIMLSEICQRKINTSYYLWNLKIKQTNKYI